MANFILEIIQIEIHLTNISMLYFCSFQINQNIAFQYGIIKYQIHLETSTSYWYNILSSHECETSAQFQ